MKARAVFNRRRVLTALCTAAGVAMVASGCGSSSSKASGSGSGKSSAPLYVLAVVDLSGTFGHYGQVDLQGLKAEATLINSEGGVNGRQIVVKDLDDQSDPAKAVIAAKDLLSSVPKKDVLFFFPGAVGVTTLAILPVTTAAKVVTISPSATSETENVKKFPYTFLAYPDQVSQSFAQVAALKQLAGPTGKAAMLIGSDSGDQANIGPLTNQMKGAGLNLVDTQTVSLTATDYTPQLEKARQDGALAVYVKIDTPSAYVTVMQGIQDLQWKNVKILAGPTAANAAVLNVIPAAVSGQFNALGERAYLQGTGFGNATFDKLYTNLQAAGPVTDLGISINDSDMVSMAAWAYKKAGSTDQSKIRSALDGLGSGNLPAGTLQVLPQPHYTAAHQDLSNADFSTFWALLNAGQPVKGQWKGTPLNLSKSS